MTSWQLISHSGNRHNSSKRAKNSYSNYCRNIALKALGDSIARSFTSDSVCDGLHNTVSSSFHCLASNRLSSSCQCSESVPWGTFQIVCGFWKWQLVVTTEISIHPSLSVSYFLEEVLTTGQLAGRPWLAVEVHLGLVVVLKVVLPVTLVPIRPCDLKQKVENILEFFFYEIFPGNFHTVRNCRRIVESGVNL